MEYIDRIAKSAVIGAAGKMGRGISLILCEHMAQLLLTKKVDAPALYLIDPSSEGLNGLREYLKTQLSKKCLKKPEKYKEFFEDKEGEELAMAYVEATLSFCHFSTETEVASEARSVFEAAIENIDLKRKIFEDLDSKLGGDAFYYTNTSSIPISEFEKFGNLKGRIMGVHFYNPPPVQKLVEMIETQDVLPLCKRFAYEFGEKINKILVPSNDIAGFIGNGHFMRDGLFAIKKARELEPTLGLAKSIALIDKISRDLLLRPMGIFQLIDYVGIDVKHHILNVMNKYIEEEHLTDALVDWMFENKVLGGQNSDGSQKAGFFTYEKGRPVSVYDKETKSYIPLEELNISIEEYLGTTPTSLKKWKEFFALDNKDEEIEKYFTELFTIESNGSKLAIEFHNNSKKICENLVKDGVTDNIENTYSVLMNGFYHLYGPKY